MSETLKFGTDGNWATKKGSTLAYNSENGNYKPLPFSFDRASSATRVNKDGLIETVGSGQPRIDFLNDSKGALLLEPSRSNLLQYSQDFSQSSWDIPFGNITSNAIISPNGSIDADEFNFIGQTEARIAQSPTLSNGTSYTFSIFIKADENGTVQSNMYTDGDNFTTINVTTEWQRVNITFVAGSTNIIFAIDNRSFSETLSKVYIYGAQVEQGSYPTSYIPTQGSAVTRLADSCEQTVPDGVIGQTEGTLFVEYSNVNFNGTSYLQSLDNGTSSERIELFIYNGNISISVRDNNVQQVNMITNISASGNNKIAFAYKLNDFALYANGSQIALDNNGTIPSINKYNSYGRYDGATGDMSNLLKSSSLYNTRLSNSELQTLTTI